MRAESGIFVKDWKFSLKNIFALLSGTSAQLPYLQALISSHTISKRRGYILRIYYSMVCETNLLAIARPGEFWHLVPHKATNMASVHTMNRHHFIRKFNCGNSLENPYNANRK